MKFSAKRIIAFLIDWWIIMIPIVLYIENLAVYVTAPDLAISMVVCFSILSVYMLFRDLIFRNASIGKKIMGIRVFDLKGNTPSIKNTIMRNVTMIFPFAPIEILLTCFTNDKTRLGDKIAKTQVSSI